MQKYVLYILTWQGALHGTSVLVNKKRRSMLPMVMLKNVQSVSKDDVDFLQRVSMMENPATIDDPGSVFQQQYAQALVELMVWMCHFC